MTNGMAKREDIAEATCKVICCKVFGVVGTSGKVVVD